MNGWRTGALLWMVLWVVGCGGGHSRGLVLEPEVKSGAAPRIWTLAVGVSKYRHSALDLEFAARDAQAVDAFFAGASGGAVPDERRTLLTDAGATRAEILLAMDRVTRAAGADDLLVVFVAMHGIVSDNGSLYFATHDTDPANLRGTGLLSRDVEDAVKDADVKHVLMLADACHSGTVGLKGARAVRAHETNRLLASLAKAKPGTAILTASRGGEFSFEDRRWGGGHGVFTHFLLRGMGGDAEQNGDGVITVSELFDFVYAAVKEQTEGAQHPELKGTFPNDLPVAQAKPSTAPPAAPAYPAPPEKSAEPPPPAPATRPVVAAPATRPVVEPPAVVMIPHLDAFADKLVPFITARATGVAVAAYTEAGLDVVPCTAPGRYDLARWSTYTSHGVYDAKRLESLLPWAEPRYRAALDAHTSLNVGVTTLTIHSARDHLAERRALEGACPSATHLVTKIWSGHFSIKASSELLAKDNRPEDCRDGERGCAPFQVELTPLR